MTDQGGLAAEGMSAQARKDGVGIFGSAGDERTSLAGQIERIEAEDVADGRHRWMQDERFFLDLHAQTGGFGPLAEHGTEAAARAVAHAV